VIHNGFVTGTVLAVDEGEALPLGETQ